MSSKLCEFINVVQLSVLFYIVIAGATPRQELWSDYKAMVGESLTIQADQLLVITDSDISRVRYHRQQHLSFSI